MRGKNARAPVSPGVSRNHEAGRMNSDIPVSIMDKTLHGIDSRIVYALATRNRAELACVCLRSLDRAHLSAFPDTTALVYVLDDSTSVDASS